MLTPLPIDALLPELVALLRRHASVVVQAAPGAGKTTRVPRALLDAGFADAGEIVVLEPRRLATRMAARRVADELGEDVGKTIGFVTRFESAHSRSTRVRFVTEGVLTRRLLHDATLAGVAVVVLDEVHERHLPTDMALALLRELQRGARPELKLVVMSATMDAAGIADFLGAPVLSSEGRAFEVAIEHAPRPADRPLETAVAVAVREAMRAQPAGDALVFLPGGLEIRRATTACAPVARDLDAVILPLHGSLSPAEQDRAVRPNAKRKIILSTNVAETSVTIDGVVAVIDSGLARVATHDPWSGLPSLRVQPVAKASAVQRAGRAGRTRPGTCTRLFSQSDFAGRPAHELPEIARADLSEAVLELASARGDLDLASFPFFERPPEPALAAAVELLARLGAVEPLGRPGLVRATELGRRMLRFPLHPRLSRLVVEAERRGVARSGALLAVVAGERGLVARSRDPYGESPLGAAAADLIARAQAFEDARDRGLDERACRMAGLDPRAAQAVDRALAQVGRLVDASRPAPRSAKEHEQAELAAILCGYPDRVGRVRRPANSTGRAGREIVFATGDSAVLSETTVVGETAFAIALDVEERAEGKSRRVRVESAAETTVDLLLECFFDRVVDEDCVIWNAGQERAELVRRLRYEGLVLEEKPVPRDASAGDPRLSRELAARAKAAGLAGFVGGDALEALKRRVEFARKHVPEQGFEPLDEEGLARAVEALATDQGLTTFAELRAAAASFESSVMPHAQRVALDAIAPLSVTLPGGRKTRVEYPPDAAPFIESRLQDFFGMGEGPRVARGRVPLVIHLLAPNQRAVQVTTDLAGFWTRHYPAIAQELRRKYPRHAWPDDPRTAQPPPPPAGRRR